MCFSFCSTQKDCKDCPNTNVCLEKDNKINVEEYKITKDELVELRENLLGAEREVLKYREEGVPDERKYALLLELMRLATDSYEMGLAEYLKGVEDNEG